MRLWLEADELWAVRDTWGSEGEYMVGASGVERGEDKAGLALAGPCWECVELLALKACVMQHMDRELGCLQTSRSYPVRSERADAYLCLGHSVGRHGVHTWGPRCA